MGWTLRIASLWGLVPMALYFRFTNQLAQGQATIAIAAIFMGAGLILNGIAAPEDKDKENG